LGILLRLRDQPRRCKHPRGFIHIAQGAVLGAEDGALSKENYLSGLTPELEFQFIDDGLDFWWSGRMSIGVMKYDSQNKRAAMLLEREPLKGQ
jgi:hypothetical protein